MSSLKDRWEDVALVVTPPTEAEARAAREVGDRLADHGEKP